MEEKGYTDDPGWFVDTRLGRFLLSLLALAAIYFLIVWNLPESEIRDRLRPSLTPTVRTLGITQDWGVFAPNPTSTSWRVEADVELADGTVIRYEFPDGEPFLGAYREFRWRKYESRIRRDQNRRNWRPTAEWIRDQYPDLDVHSVDLIRRSRKIPLPGSGDTSTYDDEQIFTLVFPSEPADEEASP